MLIISVFLKIKQGTKDLIDIASKKKNSVINACDYLSRVGLCAREYIDRDLDSKLSGGELKRIELALILAKNASDRVKLLSCCTLIIPQTHITAMVFVHFNQFSYAF